VVRPRSSLSPHLYLSAVAEWESTHKAARRLADDLAWAFRLAFFAEARDIGRRSVQTEIARTLGIDTGAISGLLESGAAHARLAADHAAAEKAKIEGSPTLVLNDGRQKLYGNVGFRVVEELVHLGEKAVVIEAKKDDAIITRCRKLGVPVIPGDATLPEILKQARVKTARAVVCATSDDLLNLEIAMLVREGNPTQRVVVRLGDSTLAETARTAAGVKLALSIPDLAAPAFAAGLLGDRVSGLFQIHGRMLAAVELNVTEADEHHFIGRSLKALAIDYGFLPVAVFDDVGRRKEYRNALQKVQAGERLLVVLPLTDLDRLTRSETLPRACAVSVSSVPLSAVDSVQSQLCARWNIGVLEAEALMEQSPFLFADELTRGEAEELVDVLSREKISALATSTFI